MKRLFVWLLTCNLWSVVATAQERPGLHLYDYVSNAQSYYTPAEEAPAWIQRQARSYITAKAGGAFNANCRFVSYLRVLNDSQQRPLRKVARKYCYLLFAYPVSDSSFYYFTVVLDDKGHLKKLLKVPDQRFQCIDKPIDSSKAVLTTLAEKLKKTGTTFRYASLKYDIHKKALVWIIEFEGTQRKKCTRADQPHGYEPVAAYQQLCKSYYYAELDAKQHTLYKSWRIEKRVSVWPYVQPLIF